jgi:hypothetical protein
MEPRPNSENPQTCEFKALKKHAVEEKDGVSSCRLLWYVNRLIAPGINHCRAEAPIARWTQWIEKHGPQPRIIERIEKVALRRVWPAPISNSAWMVKAIDRGTNHRSVLTLKRLYELTGETRFANAVKTIDSHPCRMVYSNRRNSRCKLLDANDSCHRLELCSSI